VTNDDIGTNQSVAVDAYTRARNELAAQPCQCVSCPRCGGTGKVLDDGAVGAAMRKAREKAGLTGREVARRLGLSAAYVSDLELGRRGWDAARQERYLAALK
jgi:DNA-binding XRE family transcriptional regulator